MSESLFDVADAQPDKTRQVERLKAADLRAMLRARYSANSGNGPRYVCADEVRNVAGFGGWWSGGVPLRSCDFIALDTWHSGPVRLIGHEIKVSRSDWLHELKDPDKAAAFTALVGEWWLVVSDRRIVRDGELPDGWGLLAPAGECLRAVIRAERQPQPPVAPSLLAAFCRATIRKPSRSMS